MRRTTAGCLCGAVRIEASGAPLRVGMCHCLDCRKHHGAVFYAAAVFDAAAVTVTGRTQSYEGRHFCPVCGGSVFARTEGEVEVYLGVLDTENVFEPEYELWTCRRESWLLPIPGLKSFAKDRSE